MIPFRYLRDSIFRLGCAVYAINRWLIKPHIHQGFFHSYFDDVWLIPCALPPILWLHRQFGWRLHDRPPQLSEIIFHLIFWSVLFEWIGPRFVAHITGDPYDALAYAAGAVLAGRWWLGGSWLVRIKA